MLATFALGLAVHADFFHRADNLIYDQLIRLNRQPASDKIIIVAIDDESVHRLGRFPWNRRLHARLMDRIGSARPAALMYDVLFVDPTPEDVLLAKSVARIRPILPLYMEAPGKNGEPVTIVPPVPVLRRAGARIGHVNLSPDDDGVVRRVYLAEGLAGHLWPHAAALAACQASGLVCRLPSIPNRSGFVREDPFLIPFAGSRQHFRTVPFSAVLDGGVPDAFFRDRIVLVGATATGLSDAYATPMSSRNALMPGVEVNANLVQALITGRAIVPAGMMAKLAIAITPLWLLLFGFLTARPRFNLLLGLALGALVSLASAIALLAAGLWISPVAALIGLVVVYPFWGWRRLQATSVFMHEELERFHADPDLLQSVQAHATEPVQSDIDLLRIAIARTRDLQHFVTDTLKGLPDACLVLDLDGCVRMLNDRSRSLLGEVEGRHFVAALSKLSESTMTTGTPPGPSSTTGEIVDRAGRIYDVRWSPIRNQLGNLIAWVLRLADVTALRTATRQREEALQLLTHDMRSPQASIIAALNQEKREIAPALAKRIEGYARRTLELADGFVQLARAEAQPLSFEEVNLADVVLDAVDDQWPLSSAKQISIQTSGCDDEVLVCGDRTLLTRAIINLVGNAIKYSPPSSVVECEVAVEGRTAVFAVRDQGAGLSDDQVRLLFQPFRQLGRSITDGVGLGLAFVRSVAVRHGGSVHCRSEVARGSCFEVRLPLAG